MSKFALAVIIGSASIWGVLYGADQLKKIKSVHRKRAALAIGGGVLFAFIWFLMEV